MCPLTFKAKEFFRQNSQVCFSKNNSLLFFPLDPVSWWGSNLIKRDESFAENVAKLKTVRLNCEMHVQNPEIRSSFKCLRCWVLWVFEKMELLLPAKIHLAFAQTNPLSEVSRLSPSEAAPMHRDDCWEAIERTYLEMIHWNAGNKSLKRSSQHVFEY